jgi:cell division GTPase FtsZ
MIDLVGFESGQPMRVAVIGIGKESVEVAQRLKGTSPLGTTFIFWKNSRSKDASIGDGIELLSLRAQLSRVIKVIDFCLVVFDLTSIENTKNAVAVAEICAKNGVKPICFGIEPKRRMGGAPLAKVAENIRRLERSLPAFLVMPSSKSRHAVATAVDFSNDLCFDDAYTAAVTILEMLGGEGLLSIDPHDLMMVAVTGRRARCLSEEGRGTSRAEIAVAKVVAAWHARSVLDHSPIIASGMLVSIVAPKDLRLREVHQIMQALRTLTHDQATAVFATTLDGQLASDCVIVRILGTFENLPTQKATLIGGSDFLGTISSNALTQANLAQWLSGTTVRDDAKPQPALSSRRKKRQR